MQFDRKNIRWGVMYARLHLGIALYCTSETLILYSEVHHTEVRSTYLFPTVAPCGGHIFGQWLPRDAGGRRCTFSHVRLNLWMLFPRNQGGDAVEKCMAKLTLKLLFSLGHTITANTEKYVNSRLKYSLNPATSSTSSSACFNLLAPSVLAGGGWMPANR